MCGGRAAHNGGGIGTGGTELMWIRWVFLEGGQVKESTEDPGHWPKIKCKTFRELDMARKKLEKLLVALKNTKGWVGK